MRYRYDIVTLVATVATVAMVVTVIVGIVLGSKAFEGLGHLATMIIALVPVASCGLAKSGAVDLIARYFIKAGRTISKPDWDDGRYLVPPSQRS